MFEVAFLEKPTLLSIKNYSGISRKNLQDSDFFHPGIQIGYEFVVLLFPPIFLWSK